MQVDARQLRSTIGYVPSREKAFWMRVQGGSMEPWIRDGEIILVERCDHVTGPGRYAYWLDEDEGYLVKHFDRLAGGVLEITQYGGEPKTTLYEPVRDSENDGALEGYRNPDGRFCRIEIQGRVVWPPDTGRSLLATLSKELRRAS